MSVFSDMAEPDLRFPQNAAGPFYVDDSCIDCDLCRERVPSVFHRDDEGAHSFVARQPVGEEETEACREALADCPADAIGVDSPVSAVAC